MEFENLGLSSDLRKALNDVGWVCPTDIQQEVIPLILTGGDVVGSAETGSGKTGAFGLPALQVVEDTLITEETHNNNVEMNMSDIDPGFFMEGNICYTEGNSWFGGRCNTFVSSGCYMYEVAIEGDGICRIGYGTIEASRNIGTDNKSFGFGGTGKLSYNKEFIDSSLSFKKGDIVSALVNMYDRCIIYKVNGNQVTPFQTFDSSIKELYPMIAMKSSKCSITFGPDLSYPEPGFQPFSNATRILHHYPQVLIFEPTRDLAQQVYDNLCYYKKYMAKPINIGLFIGGEGTNNLCKDIDICITTQGKGLIMIHTHKITLSQVHLLILDEADKLLENDGFNDFIDVCHRIPSFRITGERRLQVCLFTATMNNNIYDFVKQLERFPSYIDLKGKDYLPPNVIHAYLSVPADINTTISESISSIAYYTDGIYSSYQTLDTSLIKKYPELRSEVQKRYKLILLSNLLTNLKMDRVMIFARTNQDVMNIHDYLVKQNGVSFNNTSASSVDTQLNSNTIGYVGGLMNNNDRQRVITAFKSGLIRVFICTDIAARGIDIDNIPYIINMNIPEDVDTYIHRSGRGGRTGGGQCLCISLSDSEDERVWYHICNTKNRSQQKYCTNIKDNSVGGCTTLMHEQETMKAIIKRISDSGGCCIQLPLTCTIPNNIDLSKIGKVDSLAHKEAEMHLQSIHDNITILQETEKEVYECYFRLQTIPKFN